MRRPLVRYVFTLCAAGSLVFCLAVCVLWVRSYAASDDAVALRVRGGLWRIASQRGNLILTDQPQRAAEFDAAFAEEVARERERLEAELVRRLAEREAQTSRDPGEDETADKVTKSSEFVDAARRREAAAVAAHAVSFQALARADAAPVTTYRLPHPIPAAILGAPPAAWLWRAARRRGRTRTGRCRN